MSNKPIDLSKTPPCAVQVDLTRFQFETGSHFRGMTISPAVDGWNCVIRATDKKGVKVYAIQSAETIETACETVVELVCSKDASYFWRMDSFATD